MNPKNVFLLDLFCDLKMYTTQQCRYPRGETCLCFGYGGHDCCVLQIGRLIVPKREPLDSPFPSPPYSRFCPALTNTSFVLCADGMGSSTMPCTGMSNLGVQCKMLVCIVSKFSFIKLIIMYFVLREAVISIASKFSFMNNMILFCGEQLVRSINTMVILKSRS